jgi:hypothetical protein
VSDKRLGRAPALFDDAAFAEDLRRASDAGGEVARAARKTFDAEGVPVANLLACDEEGSDGTSLKHCVKLRLPSRTANSAWSSVLSCGTASQSWSLLHLESAIARPRQMSRRSTKWHITDCTAKFRLQTRNAGLGVLQGRAGRPPKPIAKLGFIERNLSGCLRLKPMFSVPDWHRWRTT